MFYKFNTETQEWYFGNEVHFPDGVKLNSENRVEKDGWKWHAEAPEEYLEWLKQFEA
jgi:hypothetical protein